MVPNDGELNIDRMELILVPNDVELNNDRLELILVPNDARYIHLKMVWYFQFAIFKCRAIGDNHYIY